MKQIFLGKRTPPKKFTSNNIKQRINKIKNTVSYSSKDIHEKVIYETK